MLLLASLTIAIYSLPSLSLLERKCHPMVRFQTRRSGQFMFGYYKAQKKTKMKKQIAFVLIASVAAFSGCYYDSFEALHPLDGYVNPCVSSLQSTYSSSITLIISY